MPCNQCPIREQCTKPCPALEAELDSPERGQLSFLAEMRQPKIIQFLERRAEAEAMRDHDHLLTAKQRAVFDLRWREGLTGMQIAARLGITYGSVRSAMTRIRNRLRREIQRK